MSASGVTGATYTYGLFSSIFSGSLPTGVTLVNGIISGVPTIPTAASSFVIEATSSIGGCSGLLTYNFTVSCPILTINPTNLANATVGVAYSQTLTQVGLTGTPTWSLSGGGLPSGLTLSTTGVISGNPTSGNTFTFTVNVQIGNCSQSITYTIIVACPTITINPPNFPNAIIGVTYSQILTQIGLNAVVGWGIANSGFGFPPGLSFSSMAGTISGIPSSIGTFNFTVLVQGNGCVQAKPYTIVVVCPTITINPANLANATFGITYSQSLTQTGLTGTPTWSLTAGNLPASLSLSTTGVISGNPTTVGTFNFTVEVTNATCSQTKVYTIVVACPTINANQVLKNK